MEAPILPPDWGLSHMAAMGDKLAEVPGPHVRYFPNPSRKRRVTVRIIRYYGTGVHYYVSISAEDNPIWDGRSDRYQPRGVWRRCWDDEEGRGDSWSSLPFRSYALAKNAALRELRKRFPEAEYEYHLDDYTDGEPGSNDREWLRWFYREGD